MPTLLDAICSVCLCMVGELLVDTLWCHYIDLRKPGTDKPSQKDGGQQEEEGTADLIPGRSLYGIHFALRATSASYTRVL